jgi:hypothetical protein
MSFLAGFLSPPRERIEVRGTTFFLQFERVGVRVNDPFLVRENRGQGALNRQ